MAYPNPRGDIQIGAQFASLVAKEQKKASMNNGGSLASIDSKIGMHGHAKPMPRAKAKGPKI